MIERGVITRAQLRSSVWRPLGAGVYADATLPLDHGLRCSGALLAAPSTAVVSGLSAAWILGVELVRIEDPVELTVPPGNSYKSRPGVTVRCQRIDPSDIDRWGTVRHTNAERTAWDLASGRDLVESVVALDAMAARRLVTRTQLLKRLGRQRSRARRAIELMDGRAESPQESRVRMQLILAGIPTPTPQFDVRHNGRWVARVDLAWPGSKLAVEYDGEWHNDRDQFRKDRRRLNALIAAGWRVIFVTADLLADSARLVAAVRAALTQ